MFLANRGVRSSVKNITEALRALPTGIISPSGEGCVYWSVLRGPENEELQRGLENFSTVLPVNLH